MKKTIIIAGGDLRYGYTAETLSEKFETYAIGFSKQMIPERVNLIETPEELPLCDVLVLPMPVSDDGIFVNAPFSKTHLSLKGLLSKVKPEGMIFGGKFGKAKEILENSGIALADYFTNEELSLRNAIPTAEGAVQMMLEEMPCTIYGSKVLILGFGRIGNRLSYVLHAMGAEVTVAERNVVKRAQIEMFGCRSIPFTELENFAGKCDVICNTVPVKVITEPILKRISKETLILDLASKPGGIDWEAAQKLGKHAVWALSLPGKTAPVTAGKIIAQTIFHLLEERGMVNA